MSVKIAETPENEQFLRVVSGLDQSGGEPRMKEIVHRIVRDLFKTIDALDITPDEFWTAVSYINDLGASSEAGLLAPGLGFEHFLDLRMDAEDKQRGVRTGTPHTIEGPLYVAGAPLSKGEARLDDGTEQGETLVMQGVVRSVEGNPISDAIVDI